MATTINREHVDMQVYDVAHGNAPEFISGNYYNFHKLKHQRKRKPKNGDVRTYTIAGRERAKAGKDDRRAARQAARQAAKQARLIEMVEAYGRKPKQKPEQAQPYHQTPNARLVYEKVCAIA